MSDTLTSLPSAGAADLPAAVTSPASGDDKSNIAILVVDDSSFNRLLLSRRLGELGYSNITTATDGIQALANIETARFDIVLLDIEMPALDGFGVLERLRAQRRRDPPVIVISAHTEMSAIVRCIELGAEDYLPKSFDLPLLRARLSAVLEKKRLRDLAAQRLKGLEAELESARLAQLALVPSAFAHLAGHRVDLHAAMVPARQVGGDFYDAIRLDGTTLLFAVADVSGKGAPAALTMARTLGLFRASARHLAEQPGVSVDPATVLARANDDLVRENHEATFVTAAVGVIDMVTGQGQLAIAAHEMPMLRTADGDVRPLLPPAPQPPLGALEDMAYRSHPFTLTPGDSVLLFSDGITEAENAAGAFFGRARLTETLAANTTPRAMVTGVFNAVVDFADGAPQADDITALALRFR
ncbi:MAG: SpoIIE family protein phosphatase [Azospirillaceae bacterium]|nr:SpoIIE family protein phosphatase [Azospirillaceae bacterium]